jgi:hypothetical protein
VTQIRDIKGKREKEEKHTWRGRDKYGRKRRRIGSEKEIDCRNRDWQRGYNIMERKRKGPRTWRGKKKELCRGRERKRRKKLMRWREKELERGNNEILVCHRGIQEKGINEKGIEKCDEKKNWKRKKNKKIFLQTYAYKFISSYIVSRKKEFLSHGTLKRYAMTTLKQQN